MEATKPKPKNRLDLLPLSKMALDEWKRLCSNTKTIFHEVAMKGIPSLFHLSEFCISSVKNLFFMKEYTYLLVNENFFCSCKLLYLTADLFDTIPIRIRIWILESVLANFG